MNFKQIQEINLDQADILIAHPPSEKEGWGPRKWGLLGDIAGARMYSARRNDNKESELLWSEVYLHIFEEILPKMDKELAVRHTMHGVMKRMALISKFGIDTTNDALTPESLLSSLIVCKSQATTILRVLQALSLPEYLNNQIHDLLSSK